MTDYHMHTAHSDAEGDAREYVERAIVLGLSEIGFADHLPFLAAGDPATTYGRLPWARTGRRLRRPGAPGGSTPTDLRVLLGVEVDYIEETLDETLEALLAREAFDYVIGSVHVVDEVRLRPSRR